MMRATAATWAMRGPKLFAGDDVGAACLRVHHDDFAVRQRHEEQHREDREGNRQQQAESGQAEVWDELGKHLLAAVGGGRDAVGREHAESEHLAESLLGETLGDERLAEELLLQAVRERLREHVGGGLRGAAILRRRRTHPAILACSMPPRRAQTALPCTPPPDPEG